MPNSPKKYLVTVAGPTAVGKTALSIRLAQDLGTEIISADSRQFFRELSIGTAKPTPEEQTQARHHFVDSHSISEAYSAGDFERDALALLDDLFLQYDVVVMTGGSGFYVKAVLEGLDDLPAPLPGLRESLMERLSDRGLLPLQEEVTRIDPEFAATPEIANPQRVVRALEVFYTSGTPISQLKQKNTRARPFQPINVALDRDRAELYQRIDLRMDMMLRDGLVEEAKSVIAYREHHALKTVGYREVYSFLDGGYEEKEMVRLLKQNSRRYAKRQLTWFRHQGNFEWFHPDDYDRILEYVRQQAGLH
ncbi:MAG: tRNA (adenosine(37)-N6)-dimethylallyltransferase MiaA [Dyadobacter sp. 50-39]|uniref:tRNA (adenosine(37)-N6)-dimethylallyltransferase MiaA n=1 Tax=Dyadobacter sp. 50-39 TaxID=1895756 RepID=UPI00095B0491|nr:tRNA (adenosine(37)-N6)-dimethylallyltransferase MiaA [Dyadobacter sp. 50-39]OJV13341.1 MAG: tRNA (adenosine(37)-N6)-dimethylallyltransferase MiaA [Dyadobacter sp. 50-39]